MGIELNDEKREPPRTATRHLGFQIDLQHKVVSITQKHSAKILKFFKILYLFPTNSMPGTLKKRYDNLNTDL